MRTMNQLSIEAYVNTVKPNLTKREEWVLEAIDNLGEASAEMVAEHYGVGINVISGRFTGLKSKGRIEPTRRDLNRFGRRVQYYRLKDDLPKNQHHYWHRQREAV